MEKIFKHALESLKTISEQDVFIIWDALAYYIRSEMSRKRGVVIPGFGTFSFTETRLDVGGNKELISIKPFFMLSERFSNYHVLTHPVKFINQAIPTNSVNYACISNLTRKYSRQTVENVIKESFNAIQHHLRKDGRITVTFRGLGVFKVDFNEIQPGFTTFKFLSVFDKYIPQR